MDLDTELGLVKHGVTFFLLAVPQYTLVGIDAQVLILYACTNFYIYIHQSMWQMFSVGPAFKGIKLIPLTSHFLFYTSS